MEKKKCEPTFHRYYSLDPVQVESQGKVVVISVCSNCSDPQVFEYFVIPELSKKGK